jgi:hypothetical protein
MQVQVADLDGDEDKDLVVAHNADVTWFSNPLSDAWTDLGQGLAGSTAPRLGAGGTLQPGSDTTVGLWDAPPSANTYWVAGLSDWSVPFKGGVLVPSLDVLAALPADPNGAFALSFAWPAGLPMGPQVWWQVWIPDAGALVGFSATNAMVGTTP